VIEKCCGLEKVRAVHPKNLRVETSTRVDKFVLRENQINNIILRERCLIVQNLVALRTN
jgi:hypothetical protein